jgi:hypothetical protein
MIATPEGTRWTLSTVPGTGPNPSATVGLCYGCHCAQRAQLFSLTGRSFQLKGRKAVGHGHRNKAVPRQPASPAASGQSQRSLPRVEDNGGDDCWPILASDGESVAHARPYPTPDDAAHASRVGAGSELQQRGGDPMISGTLIAPANGSPTSGIVERRGGYHCECGHVLRVFGGGRHRTYYEPGNAHLDDPVMNGACPACGRGLPGVPDGLPGVRRTAATPGPARGSRGVSPVQATGRPRRAAAGRRCLDGDPRSWGSVSVSDAHIRILRRVARQRRLELDDHDAVDHRRVMEAGRRRRHLEHSATRTTERLAEAQARRRYRDRSASPEQSQRAAIQEERCDQIKVAMTQGDSDGCQAQGDRVGAGGQPPAKFRGATRGADRVALDPAG